MENKEFIIICVIAVIIAVVGFAFVTGAFEQKSDMGKTPFETNFMSGSFAGNVEKVAENDTFLVSYKDKEHNITYNLTTMDNSSALMEIYKFQGVQGPDHRKLNGNDWNIYFAEAMPVVNNKTVADPSQKMGIIIAECQKESQGYIVYSIIDTSKVNFTLNTFSDSYTKFIEPLLKTIDLKHSDKVPAVHEQFGLSKDDFNKQLDLIHQVEAGNRSALQGQQQ